MILQKEIRDLSMAWGVPPETVDKDYVLGHFLAAFNTYYGNQILFKGGTCLRKCYFPGYRFSEDLDFTAKKADFQLKAKDLQQVCKNVEEQMGILFYVEEIHSLTHQNIRKGDQVKIRYWGANHSKNQAPTPPERWLSKIKLEVSTEEVSLLADEMKTIHHPYSDSLISTEAIACYSLEETVSEKLRALVQRSYTAPRDYYDLFYLTQKYNQQDWQRIKVLFLKKMEHKGIVYTGADQLISPASIQTVRNAWKTSIEHQLNEETELSSDEMINEVVKRIKENL